MKGLSTRPVLRVRERGRPALDEGKVVQLRAGGQRAVGKVMLIK